VGETSSSTVDIFINMLKNPVLKYFIRVADGTCTKCGLTYLKAALSDFSLGHQTPRSLKCHLFSELLSMILTVGCATFKIDLETARSSLRVPYFRSGLINVLEGISKYGVTRPQRLASPFLVVWNLTNACNLRCQHCYQRADKPTPDELSTEEAKRIIDQLYESNVSSIAFSGGEPMMRPDFYELAQYAANKGFYVSVATNGTLLTRQNVKRLKEAGVGYVEVSLDGARAETHDAFRGVEGAFDRTVHGIRNAVEGGLYTGIATVSTRNSLYEIPKIFELAKSLGVGQVIVFNFVPTGRGEEIVNIDLSPNQREELLKYLYKELTGGEIEALSTAPQYSRVCLQQSLVEGLNVSAPTHFAALQLNARTRQLADFLGGCGAGRLYCAIQPNGIVTPCVFLPIVVGDLRKQTLKEIWETSKVLSDLSDRDALKGRCGHCQYRHVCGGCRARAYAYYGDYLAPDPGCIRELEEPSTFFTKRASMQLAVEAENKARA
jgi:radical SAM protein with 4Fe4S-binding SPASM domain